MRENTRAVPGQSFQGTFENRRVASIEEVRGFGSGTRHLRVLLGELRTRHGFMLLFHLLRTQLPLFE
jgi:hypothetical protein